MPAAGTEGSSVLFEQPIRPGNFSGYDKGYTPLHSAAQNGHLEVCKVILENIPEKNPKTKDGSTPLLFAARQGLYDVCKIILENVENKNPKNDFGMTPLKLSTTYGHSAVAKLISSYLEE